MRDPPNIELKRRAELSVGKPVARESARGNRTIKFYIRSSDNNRIRFKVNPPKEEEPLVRRRS